MGRSCYVYDRAHSAISEIEPGMIDWDQVFEGVNWFHWTGITPAISQGAADVCLEAIQKANEKGMTVSCDLNYRKNLWNYDSFSTMQKSGFHVTWIDKCQSQ